MFVSQPVSVKFEYEIKTFLEVLNSSENVVCQILAILFGPDCVNSQGQVKRIHQ